MPRSVKKPAASRRPSLLVAVSGGLDSVVLLHSLHSLGTFNLHVAHLNHCLRGNASQADERFVRKLASTWNLKITTAQRDVKNYAKKNSLSLETAARNVRYDFLFKTARKHGIRHICLAHHADDQVETFLQRLFRGSGLTGLTGMDAISKREGFILIRPLLSLRRSDILAYARHHQLTWREDKSNTSPEHLRNRIRHELIPLLDQMFQREISPNILRLMEVIRAENDLYSIPSLTDTLSVHEIQTLPIAWQRRLLHAWLTRHHGVGNCGFEEVEAVRSLAFKGQTIPRVNLPGNLHVARKRKALVIEGKNKKTSSRRATGG